MKPGPDIIVRCPYCQHHVRQRSYVTCNNIGSVLWSDGKLVASMMPEMPTFTFCSECGELYFIDDENMVGMDLNSIDNNPDYQSEYIEMPTFWEYIKALEILPDKKYIRVKILHSFNDYIREKKSNLITLQMKSQHIRNLYELLSLLNEAILGELFIKAEVYRNLGLFERGIQILNKVEPSYAQAIKEKYLFQIGKSNKELFILSDN